MSFMLSLLEFKILCEWVGRLDFHFRVGVSTGLSIGFQLTSKMGLRLDGDKVQQPNDLKGRRSLYRYGKLSFGT